MSSMGVGQGLAEGMSRGGQFLMQGLQIGQQNKRYTQYNQMLQRQLDANMEWKRGEAGLPPSYVEEDQANQAAVSSLPTIPSSTPIQTPGPLGIPETRFDTGRSVSPRPAAPPPTGQPGAMSLLPPSSGPKLGGSLMRPRLSRGF